MDREEIIREAKRYIRDLTTVAPGLFRLMEGLMKHGDNFLGSQEALDTMSGILEDAIASCEATVDHLLHPPTGGYRQLDPVDPEHPVVLALQREIEIKQELLEKVRGGDAHILAEGPDLEPPKRLEPLSRGTSLKNPEEYLERYGPPENSPSSEAGASSSLRP